MEKLYLTNTLGREKEVFRTVQEGRVRMFTCGPSVYGRAHLGNYRTFLFEDVLERYLEFIGYDVDRVINFTDVEDKAIEEAQAKGVTLKELTAPVEELFLQEAASLNIRLPAYIPRASTCVDQAAQLINILLEKGYAYFYGKDVFYDPLKYKGFGRLYGLDMSRWPKQKRRFQKDTYPGQRWNLGDFILWHGGRGDHIYWNTDIGVGRPSWNIQDAAIITKHLGYRIDLACGGLDNLYRHHDYNLAVVESVSGETFCPFWLHGGYVLVNGTKMSKSRGNMIYLDDLVNKGYQPNSIRFALLYRHYRKNLNIRPDYLDNAVSKLEALIHMAKELTGPDARGSGNASDSQEIGLEDIFREKMNDDLDVKGAFDRIFREMSKLMTLKSEGTLHPATPGKLRGELRRIDRVLQVMGPL